MFPISKQTLGKAFLAAALSTAVSVLIASSVVPLLGGTYDGIGMWLSFLCPMVIAFPGSGWQFHQNEKLRHARDELAALHLELNRMHSELSLAHATLQERARHDAMTGGLAREAFFTELQTMSERGQAGTLLVADADNFKRINDGFGHQTGDEALLAIARAISATIGVKDFRGRVGGEEFAIFLEGSGRDEALAVADTIRKKVEATEIRRERGRVPVTLSIGGIGITGRFDVTRAMSDADRRLYRAKRRGRNLVVLDEDLQDDLSFA